MSLPPEAAARAARAAGDHAAAVCLWGQMLDAAPQDWRLALELRQDIYAAGRYPDSDARFRRAARFLPDADWLSHYAALWSFHADDLDAIAARARALLEAAPQQPLLHAILGDVARQRRDWPAAAAAFAAAAQHHPEQPHYPVKAAQARLYSRLTGRTWPADGPAYAAYVLNLDRNPERLAELHRQFAGAPVPLRRLQAVEGSRLPGAAVARLAGTAAAARGTLGCFLSHAAAWEALVASGGTHALVLEDDVIPLLALPPRLGPLNLPADCELCFVNDRMEPKRDHDAADGFTAVPLAAVMAAFHPDENAPGGDGYIISRGGAAKLLDWVAADAMDDDVDWRLIAYALTPDERAAIPPHAFARQNLDRLSARSPRPDRLRAYALHPALIRTIGVSSDREDQNRAAPG